MEKADVPDPGKQIELKAARTAAAKTAAAPKTGTYTLKRHKRKGAATALASHHREEKKQICQLLETVLEDAESKMDELVQELNSGKISREEAVRVVDQIKGKAHAVEVPATID